MARVKDLFEDLNEYSELLEAAEVSAECDWEVDFVDGLIDKYRDFKGETYLSEKQLEILERIANQ